MCPNRAQKNSLRSFSSQAQVFLVVRLKIGCLLPTKDSRARMRYGIQNPSRLFGKEGSDNEKVGAQYQKGSCTLKRKRPFRNLFQKVQTSRPIQKIPHALARPRILLKPKDARACEKEILYLRWAIPALSASPTGPGRARLRTKAAAKKPVSIQTETVFLISFGKKDIHRRATKGIDREIKSKAEKK